MVGLVFLFLFLFFLPVEAKTMTQCGPTMFRFHLLFYCESLCVVVASFVFCETGLHDTGRKQAILWMCERPRQNKTQSVSEAEACFFLSYGSFSTTSTVIREPFLFLTLNSGTQGKSWLY